MLFFYLCGGGEVCFLPEKDNVGRGQMDCFDCQLRAD